MQENSIISYKSLISAFFGCGYPRSNNTEAKFESLISRGMGKFSCKVRKRTWEIAQGSFKKSCKKILNYVLSRKA